NADYLEILRRSTWRWLGLRRNTFLPAGINDPGYRWRDELNGSLAAQCKVGLEMRKVTISWDWSDGGLERWSIRGLRQLSAGVSDPGYRCPKLVLPACTFAFERLLDALDHSLANGGRIAKTDFAFRRMHIYVNARRID